MSHLHGDDCSEDVAPSRGVVQRPDVRAKDNGDLRTGIRPWDVPSYWRDDNRLCAAGTCAAVETNFYSVRELRGAALPDHLTDSVLTVR